MKKVLSSYVVKQDTLALYSAKSFEYRTIVITSTGKLYVKMTPLEIIKESCMRDMVTYEGRRKAVHKLTGYKNKVPILINALYNIFSFPTASPLKEDCVWLFFHHIKDIKDIQKNGKGKGKYKSTVYFTNDEEMLLDVSYFTLNEQFSRTAVCESMYRSQGGLDPV